MREAQKLLKMKDQLEEAKSDTDKAEGRLGAAMDSLRKEYGHTTLKQAGKEEQKIATTIENLQSEIRDGVEELEDTYEWD